jgi:hypothetical protein
MFHGKSILPTDLTDTALRWYHLAIGYTSQNSLYDKTTAYFYHLDCRDKMKSMIPKHNHQAHAKSNTRIF